MLTRPMNDNQYRKILQHQPPAEEVGGGGGGAENAIEASPTCVGAILLFFPFPSSTAVSDDSLCRLDPATTLGKTLIDPFT